MRSLLALIPYFKRHKRKLLLGLLYVAGSSFAQILMPLFVGRTIDQLTNGTATTTSVMQNALLIIASTLTSGFLYYLVRQQIIVASREIEFDLRNDLLAHVETLSMRFFQSTPQGEIMAYATNDINAVRSFVGPAVMYSMDTMMTFIGALVRMISLSPLLTLVTIAPLPVMSFAVFLIGRKIHPLFDKVQKQYADLTARATESISGVRVVKAYVREEHEAEIFDTESTNYFTKNMGLIKVQGLMQPVVFGFVGLSLILLIAVGAPLIVNKSVTIGTLTQFVIYLGMLAWPFIALGWITNMVQRAAASMQRLLEIFKREPEVRDTASTDTAITKLKGNIRFENVSFRYSDEAPWILRNVSLNIPSGKTLAIIGRTGAGKSTFVNLIPRLYDVTEGAIRIDEHDIRTIPLHTLRTSIGYVAQEPFLFSQTIEQNLSFGVERMPLEGLEEAARAADIHDNIVEFPESYQTMIGERGITLSGGQKQRASLARAIVRNPPILILDDAMSAVDTSTEERILSQLRHLMRDRTSIIISHRVSTVKEADTIIVLRDGAISEQGSHDELLELRGAYHDLYRKQLLEDELERV